MIELAAEISTIIMLCLLLAANRRFCLAIQQVARLLKQGLIQIVDWIAKTFGK